MVSVSCYFISRKIYKYKANPITIYLSVWILSVSLHQSKLIYFYDLSITTWIVIISAQLIFVTGCLFGAILPKKRVSRESISIKNSNKQRNLLKKYIIFSSLVSAIGIIPKILFVVQTYGLSLFGNISQIYTDSITGQMEYDSGLDTGGFIFVALVFGGIYLYKYRFEKVLIFPVILLILSQLTSGSRGNLIAGALLFISPLVLGFDKWKKNNLVKKIHVNRTKVLGLLLISVLFLITWSRSANGDLSLPYASEFMKSLNSSNKTIYSIVFYFSAPIAVLNEYLQDPIHSHWGAATFRFFYIMLDQFGFVNYNVNFIGEYLYNTPIPTNVLTYIGELIYDFNYGAFLVIFILGFVFDVTFRTARGKETIFSLLLVSVTFSLVALSFFAWFLRPSIFWSVLIIGGTLALIADRSNLIEEKNIRRI
ncbi:O-antigen polymerase [Lysinibacillus fusiformis]|nr:O-antigen polymerase [Lysinibacillus fusiformis]